MVVKTKGGDISLQSGTESAFKAVCKPIPRFGDDDWLGWLDWLNERWNVTGAMVMVEIASNQVRRLAFACPRVTIVNNESLLLSSLSWLFTSHLFYTLTLTTDTSFIDRE